MTCGDKAGTHTGIDRHRNNNEDLCAACSEFRRAYNRAYKERQRRAAGVKPIELQPCGTVAAAWRHRRKPEPLCAACVEAERKADAERQQRARARRRAR